MSILDSSEVHEIATGGLEFVTEAEVRELSPPSQLQI